MIKKLIALVEALMIVSIFCIGFATWSITSPSATTPTGDPLGGGIYTQGVQDISLDTIGFGTTTPKQTGFDYSLSGTQATFSKTTITVETQFLKNTMESLAYSDVYRLVLDCTNPNADAFDIFSNQATLLIPPTYATVHLKGFPNQKVIGVIQTASKEKLSATFPVKSTSQFSLYNLVSNSTGTDDDANSADLIFTFEFSVPTGNNAPSSNHIKAICWTAYTLSFKISAT